MSLLSDTQAQLVVVERAISDIYGVGQEYELKESRRVRLPALKELYKERNRLRRLIRTYQRVKTYNIPDHSQGNRRFDRTDTEN